MTSAKTKRIDRRTVDRYREKGIIKEADYQNYIQGLPDDSAHAEYIQMDVHDADLGLDDDMDDSDDESDDLGEDT